MYIKKYAKSKYLDISHLSINDPGFFDGDIPAELAEGLDPILYHNNIHYAKNYKHLFDTILRGLKGIHYLECKDPSCPIKQIHFHCSNCGAPYSLKHYNTYHDLVNHPKYCKWCGQAIKYPLEMYTAITDIKRETEAANRAQEEAADEATLEELDEMNKYNDDCESYEKDQDQLDLDDDTIDQDEDENLDDEDDTTTDQTIIDGVWRNGAFIPFDPNAPIGYDPTHPDSPLFDEANKNN